jgi:prepilin-type processing-associated H-X9-DG protein
VAWHFRRLVVGSGASLLFSLSALSVAYGLARLATPLLCRDGALREQLLCLGAVNAYDLALLGAMFLLTSWRRLPGDAVMLGMLSALFLVAGGMLLAIPAADHPRLVLALGLVALAAGAGKLWFLRGPLRVPMSAAMATGLLLLLAWNTLVAAWLGHRLGGLGAAGLPVAEGMRHAWLLGWWVMLAGTGCLAMASMVPPAPAKDCRPLPDDTAFFHRPAMGWLFSALLLGASVIHQRALGHAFGIGTWAADFLPVCVLGAVIILGWLRHLRPCPWPLEVVVAMLPLSAIVYVFARETFPAQSLLGPGVLWHPLVLLGAAAILLGIDGWRHRSPAMPVVLVTYLLAGVLLAGATAGSPATLNWTGAGALAVAIMFGAGLWPRQPWLTGLGLALGTVGLLASPALNDALLGWQLNPVPTVLAGAGAALIGLHFHFGRAYPRLLADAGALLVACFALFIHGGEDFALAMAAAGLVAAALGLAVVWRFGNLPLGLLLCLPLGFCVLFSFRKMTDWHFVGLGFFLLAAGTAFSLWKRNVNKLLRLVFLRYRRQLAVRTGARGDGNTLAVMLTVVVVIAFMAGMLLPALSMSRGQTRRISCASNLKQIGLAMRMYAADHDGHFPPPDGAAGLEVLRANGYLENHKMFTCPATTTTRQDGIALTEENIDYIYRGGLTEASPVDTPVAWDKPDNHKQYGNVLYVGGHVTGFAGQDWPKKAGIEDHAREDAKARP